MAATYLSAMLEWLANVPAEDLTDAVIAERAAYWGLTVTQFNTLLAATGFYTVGGIAAPFFVQGGTYNVISWSVGVSAH